MKNQSAGEYMGEVVDSELFEAETGALTNAVGNVLKVAAIIGGILLLL